MSERGLLVRAALIGLLYGALHLFGGRACAGFLSGTPVGGTASLLLGCAYVVLHFGFVLVAPILIIAAGLLRLRRWKR